jgi:D-sedoheptulose 7-phosphate isomerase
MSGDSPESSSGYLRQLKGMLDRIDGGAIDSLAERVFQACSEGKQVLVFGNGGSAYTASHFVTDLVKTAAVQGCPRLRAVSLVDNYGLTTALANDISYEDTFVFPLAAYARSTS